VDVVETTRALIRDETAEAALARCRDRLEAAGLAVERHDGAEAIVARRGEGGPALSGHVDVVPAGEEWTRAPFGGERESGRVHGRGASDMRGPVACMLAAAEATEAPMQVVLTTDEETTMDGVRQLVDDGVLEDAPAVVVGEPTGMDVAYASKGVLWVRVHAEGARVHASTPRGEDGRGPSAPERLGDALGDVPAEPLRLAHPDLGPATAAITGLGSEGTPFNVLAGRARARVDCRFPPPGTPDDVLGALRSALDLPREGLDLAVAKREPAFLGDEGLAEAASRALSGAGLDAHVTAVMYASEAGHWQRAADTVLCGPGSIARAHGPDEFVTEEELAAGVRGYEALVEGLAA